MSVEIFTWFRPVYSIDHLDPIWRFPKSWATPNYPNFNHSSIETIWNLWWRQEILHSQETPHESSPPDPKKCLASGNLTVCYWSHGHRNSGFSHEKNIFPWNSGFSHWKLLEIVDFPMKKMVDLSIAFCKSRLRSPTIPVGHWPPPIHRLPGFIPWSFSKKNIGGPHRNG